MNKPICLRQTTHTLPSKSGRQSGRLTTGAFSRNVGKLFSELKLITFLFVYVEANWETTENGKCLSSYLKEVMVYKQTGKVVIQYNP